MWNGLFHIVYPISPVQTNILIFLCICTDWLNLTRYILLSCSTNVLSLYVDIPMIKYQHVTYVSPQVNDYNHWGLQCAIFCIGHTRIKFDRKQNEDISLYAKSVWLKLNRESKEILTFTVKCQLNIVPL